MVNEHSGLKLMPQSLEWQAADVLREQILKGDLAPGSRLIETRLAEQLSLSRGTIRTALHQLTHEGLVTQVLHKGWTVQTLSLQDTWELYTLRNVLESFAAQLLAQAVTAEKSILLQSALTDLADTVLEGDVKKIAEADFALHKTIIELSGHKRLQAQYKLIEHQIRLSITSCDSLFPDLSEITAQHEKLVEAICSRNVSLAEKVAREHSADGKMFGQYSQVVNDQPTLSGDQRAI